MPFLPGLQRRCIIEFRMLPSLLSTKLFIPPVREGAVTRSRLIQKLMTGLGCPGCFALLSGPAGFGKTTLLSEFAAQSRQPVAWLSLDEGDNEPNRFWAYLIKACQTAVPQAGETALALLRSPQPVTDDAIPTLLINDLAGRQEPLVLVFDDYHAIQNPALHAGVLFLLDHLPNHIHLIVATRTDPPWPLARFRARNRMIEIRAQDLRFTLDEAAAFFRQTMGLALSTGSLAALSERTEGWAAGLQLAALSMQGRGDADAFIQAFTGSNVYIAEYLIDEVLRRQPEELQAFLLQTSILDRLSGALCDAVTGREGGEAALKALQQANIFIIPLDDEGRWFRYHRLFADLLKARLHTSSPKSMLERLHQNAAGWYEHNGMVGEAVEHSLSAGDYPRMVRLVEAAALPLILQANVRTVEAWLQAIPEALVEKSARINMAHAWMNLLRGMPQQAAPYLERLRDIFAAAGPTVQDPSLQAEWLAIQAELLIAQGRAMESRDLAIRAQEMLPQVEPYARSMLYVTLAKAYQQTLDDDRAMQVFQMIVQDARQSGDITFEVLGTSAQAQTVLKQGRLHHTFEIANEGIRRVEQSGIHVPFSATLYGELGQVYFHWHKFDLARQNLRRSMEISGRSGYSDPEIYFHLMLSKMCQMEGDIEGTVQEMEQASRLARMIPPVMVRANMIAQQVRVYLDSGQRAAAEHLLAAEGFRFDDAFIFPDLPPGAPVTLEAGLVYNSALRVMLSRAQSGRPDLAAAIELAGRLIEGELRSGHLPAALETLLLLSQMHALLGDHSASRAAAGRALALAEPEGFLSTFVEEGRPLAAILKELAGQEHSAFLQEVLGAYPAADDAGEATRPISAASPSVPQVPLVEPLSARELEVLRLIAAGDSNRVIAEKLVITVSAVKKHSGNIYGKLAVNSRTQAVSLARQLGLLATHE